MSGVARVLLAAEARRRMRSPWPAVLVSGTLLLLGLLLVTYLSPRLDAIVLGRSPLGPQLFALLALTQLALLLLVAPLTTAGVISGERQRHTWDWLRLTRFSAAGIAGSKLLAALALNLVLLAISLPFLALAMLIGGVTPADLLHVVLVTAAAVALLVSASVLISALCRGTGAAVALSLVLSLALVLSLLLAALGAPSPAALAVLNPLAALRSALPAGGLWAEGAVHPLGDWPFWATYSLLATSLALLLTLPTLLALRYPPPWLARGG